MFKKEHPVNSVTYNYYKLIFKRDFKKLKFARPRSDTCNTCDKLEATVTANTSRTENQDTTIKLNLHVRKSEKAEEEMTISAHRCLEVASLCFV